MNKKILGIGMSLFAMFLLATPVMAKGPVKAADKNPNAEILGGFVLELTSPSQVINRWFGVNVPHPDLHIIVKPANEFNCPTELDVGDNFTMWLTNPDYRGKWVHMNKGTALPPTGYLGLFTIFGLPVPTDVPDEGVYIWGAKT